LAAVHCEWKENRPPPPAPEFSLAQTRVLKTFFASLARPFPQKGRPRPFFTPHTHIGTHGKRTSSRALGKNRRRHP
jgi:hypothetical protein